MIVISSRRGEIISAFQVVGWFFFLYLDVNFECLVAYWVTWFLHNSFFICEVTTPRVRRLCLVIMSCMSEFICSSSMFYINDNSGSENSLVSRRILNFWNNTIQEILRTCQSYNSFIKYLLGVWISPEYFIWCGGKEVSKYSNLMFSVVMGDVSPYCVTCRT